MAQWITFLLLITSGIVLLGAAGAFEGGFWFILTLPLAMLAAAIVASRTIVYRDSAHAFKALADTAAEPDERH